jgi:orotidine-5'-phosphate decarboxylase
MTAAADPNNRAPAAVSPGHFADRLHAAITRTGVPGCIGLDPVLDRLPASVRSKKDSAAEQIERFCLGVIETVAGIVPAVKPQSACFERYGQAGYGALRRVIIAARAAGLIVILDAKRGDVGFTAEHYAAAIFGAPGAEPPGHAADAVTLNAYLGMDSVAPFLAYPGRGVFILVRTSNPGSDDVQSQRLADGRTVAEMMADHIAALGRGGGRLGAHSLSSVGAVVGATKSAEAGALRARMPETIFLVPGYGAQGGTLDDLRPMLRSAASAADSGILVNAGRSVLFPPSPEGPDFRHAIREAAKRFAADLTSLF